MATNVEIKSKPNENPLSMIRRFSRSSQQANVVSRVKQGSYKSRALSDFEKKKIKLRKIKRKQEFERLYKLGKVSKGRRKGRRK